MENYHTKGLDKDEWVRTEMQNDNNRVPPNLTVPMNPGSGRNSHPMNHGPMGPGPHGPPHHGPVHNQMPHQPQMSYHHHDPNMQNMAGHMPMAQVCY